MIFISKYVRIFVWEKPPKINELGQDVSKLFTFTAVRQLGVYSIKPFSDNSAHGTH